MALMIALYKYESNGDKDKKLLIEGNLDKIRPIMINMINDLKTHDERKSQLTMAIIFILLKIPTKRILCILRVIK